MQQCRLHFAVIRRTALHSSHYSLDDVRSTNCILHDVFEIRKHVILPAALGTAHIALTNDAMLQPMKICLILDAVEGMALMQPGANALTDGILSDLAPDCAEMAQHVTFLHVTFLHDLLTGGTLSDLDASQRARRHNANAGHHQCAQA